MERAGASRSGRSAAAGHALSLVLMAALALCAALPYLAGGGLRTFLYLDDGAYVYQNPDVLRGITWSGTRWAFTTFHMSNWHPLTWLSHMLDVAVFGKAAWGHHLTSVLLHALNTALLFLALRRLTGRLWTSAFAAALFGLHPLRVESVAWVAERKDVLAGLFFALLLLAYERYARRGGPARYLLVATLLALGLMAKPMLVTAPFVLLLLDYWPLGRTRAAATGPGGPRARPSPAALLAEKAPLLALSAASSAVSFLAQRHGDSLTRFSPATHVANALVSCVNYLAASVWPSALAVYYPHPITVPAWKAAGSLLLLACGTAAAARWLTSRPYFAVGWLWFLGMLVPVIGLVQIGAQARADRYTYLPSLGLGLLAAWGAAELFRKRRLRPAAPAAGALLVAAALFATTVAQAGRWKDSETLFRHTLAVTSRNWVIHLDLGNVLLESRRPAEAILHYQEALAYRPDDEVAYYDIGLALDNLGRYDEAIASFQRALQLRPGYAKAHHSLGMLLYQLGRGAEGAFHIAEAQRLQVR